MVCNNKKKFIYNFANFVHLDPMNPEYEISRKRRNINYRNYNRYTQTISNPQYSSSRARRSVLNHDPFLDNLPINRTFVFDCYDAAAELCIQARFSVNNFKVGNTPILVSFNFTIDLATVGKLNTFFFIKIVYYSF